MMMDFMFFDESGQLYIDFDLLERETHVECSLVKEAVDMCRAAGHSITGAYIDWVHSNIVVRFEVVSSRDLFSYDYCMYFPFSDVLSSAYCVCPYGVYVSRFPIEVDRR